MSYAKHLFVSPRVAVLAFACVAHHGLAAAEQPPAAVAPRPQAATKPVVQIKGEVPKDFVEHKLGEAGASLRAPRTWKVLPPKEGRLTLADEENGAIVVFRVMGPEPGGDTAAAAEALLARLRASVPGFTLVSSDVAQVRDKRALRIVYGAKREGRTPARISQFAVHTKRHHYALICTATLEAADRMAPVFEQVLLSAQLP